MLHNQETKLRYKDISQAQYNSQHNVQQNRFIEILKKSVNDFSKWPAKKQMLAAGAVGAIFFTVLPTLSAALPLALIGVATALTLYFAVKTVFYAAQGIEWSAEKTIEGVKYSAQKVKDGAIYSKNKIEEGYEYSSDSLKRGASAVKEKMKEKTSNTLHSLADTFYNASGKENYLEKIKEFTTEQKNQSQEIRGELKEIFDNKKGNVDLVKNILSGIVSKINLKIEEEKSSGWIENTDKWEEQKKFINKLDAGKVQSLLTQRSLPKDSYFIDSIFSEHHSQIKEVIEDYQESYILANLSKMFDKEEKKVKNKASPRDLSHIFSPKKQAVYSEAVDSRNFATIKGRPSLCYSSHYDLSHNVPIKVNVPTVPIERSNSFSSLSIHSKEASMSDSLSAEFDRGLKKLEGKGYTSTPKSKNPVSNLINKFETMNSSDSLNNQSITTSARSSFSFGDSGNGSKNSSLSSSKSVLTDTDINNQKALMIKELKERRNSLPASKIDVHTVMQQQHIQKAN